MPGYEAGAGVQIVAPESGQVKGWRLTDWGDTIKANRVLDGARADEYDALLLPGGVLNPDKLRINERA